MRRARKVRDELAPALFPFLAVLVCTMGALVLLLMLIVSQARASVRHQVADLEQIEQEELDGLYLTVEALQMRRKQFQEQVDQLRDEASHYEDHLSRLQAEHQQLAERAESLEALVRAKESSEQKDAEQLEGELERLREKIAQAEAELEEGKDESDGRGPAFAIIPYQGGSGTRRRPIYLECTSQGVIVHPEGVLLGLDDLRPPHGPGNPLETVLRTIRSGLQETDGYQHLSESPYPLLLVRPDGIAAYALARAAMGGWDDRFGYELITAEMPLAFPQSPPGLKTKINTALERARQRRTAMIAALPGMRAIDQDWNDQLPGGAPALGAGQGSGETWGPGGTVADGLGTQAGGFDGERWNGLDGESNDEWPGLPPGEVPGVASAGPGGNGLGGGLPAGIGEGSLAWETSGGSAITHGGSATGGGIAGGMGSGAGGGISGGISVGMPGGNFVGDAGAGVVGQSGGSEPGMSAGFSGGVQAPSSGGGDVQGVAGALGQGAIAGGEFGAKPGGALGGGGAGSAAAMQAATGGQSGGTSGGYPQGGQAGGSAGQAGGPTGSLAGAAGGQPAAGTAGSASQAGMAGGGSGSAAMSTSMLDIDMDDRLGTPGIQPNDRLEGQTDDPLGGFGYQRRASQGGSSSGGGQAQGEAGDSQPADSLQPISVSRGRGWATESMSRQGTPMIRVIHVVAMPDRWLVMDERSSQRIQEQIELKAGPRRVSDQLAVAVARRIDSWGLPLSGGYWRPHLHVAVAPGAEWSAQQLQRMLEASGLELHVRPINPPSPAADAGAGGSRR